MSETPRTDALLYMLDGGLPVGNAWKVVEFAYQLERELAAAQADAERWRMHMQVMRDGDENALTTTLFDSTADEYEAAIDTARSKP